jgi:tRNA A-37 threonylcarbamoyl transferase component Bud32
MDDFAGRLQHALRGTYTIERELGGGGMALVFLATEHALDRKVVIKVLSPELAGDINSARFAQEVRLAAQLQHPHIVPLLSSGDAEGLPYYVMPFVSGETLRARLLRSGTLTVRDTVAVLRDVAKALAFAHASGIVHRDIKPENILLAGGSAVVSDFGIAKAITESAARGGSGLTQLGMAIGTPAYMAPEQAAGDPGVDHRADLYACGILAYELLTGRPPFVSTSAHDLIRSHFTESVAPLASTRPDVPEALSELVQRCLAKDPRDRPASADAVSVGLEALAGGGSAVRTPQPQAASPRRRVRVERITGVVTLAVVLLAAGAFALTRMKDPPAPAVGQLVAVEAPRADADPVLSAAANMSVDVINAGLSEMDWVRLAQPRGSAATARIDDGTAADVVVAPELYRIGDSVQVQLRVMDGRTGRLLRGLPPVRLSQTPTLDEVREAVSPALSLVGYATHPLIGTVMLPALGPPRFEAFTEFASAVSLWAARADTGAVLEISAHLRAAQRLDPTFLQVDSWSVLNAVRYYQQPQLLREVETLLPRIERSNSRRSPFESILARHASLTAHRSTAQQLETMRELARLAPGLFGGAFPARLLDLNRPRQALAAVEKTHVVASAEATREGTGPQSALRADILHYLGNHSDELAEARRAREAAPDIRHVRRELRALVGLRRSAEVERRLDEANDASGTGPFDFAGDVFLQIGLELVAHGDSAAGRRVIRRAVQWFSRRTPRELESQHVRFRAALAYMADDDLDRALPLSLELQREYLGDPRYLGTVGVIYARLERTDDAETVLGELAAMPAVLVAGAPTYERARISAALGRRDQAVSLLQESLRQGQGWAIRWRLHFFPEWLPYADYPPFRRIITPEG